MPVAVVLLGLGLLASGCGDKQITRDEVEAKAQAYLDNLAKDQGGTNASVVTCPGDLDAKVGKIMRCTAKDPTGQLTVLVRVNSVDGDTSRLSMTIDR